jgi:putative restriction endonuclease
MVKGLRDFLDITEADAVSQWLRIGRRAVPEAKKRQEDYLPVEVLLCFGLFRIISPHRFGGQNIDRVPPPVKALARTLRRSAGSLTSKMLNLDNSRKNSGRFELQLYIRLSGDPELFSALYIRILQAARAVRLTDKEVPDFLDLLDWPGGFPLLGQEELGREELDQGLDEAREETSSLVQRTGLEERETQRLVESRIRLGQHRFAREVLATYQHRCGFCGFSPGPLERQRLLTASHIKPWRVSNSKERLNPRNGIAACPTHDVAFDRGLLTVNGGYRIHRAGSLQALIVSEPIAASYFGECVLKPALVLPFGSQGPSKAFLDYHRRHVFQSADPSPH